ncbi:molybdopterin molybdotransferase MoeA [Maribacter hydrothermalis]|uniref:Molybdopterin molybdenumtransferase n=1 Tax=Maribacter hydrothermalis TaxID=1836467 RepID=A0A1B7YXH0_9FLAO|nr:gephyrin-like molybdotransferase Glp [Maribacter hydrothermalis]APQ16758.1 molybdopterin molybdenumtransferase MoeA [Maribacter hydrothermalis]OBR35185.1 molybdopterin molybdenumtransferase MoeA [Maribacter hydrothermalis]
MIDTATALELVLLHGSKQTEIIEISLKDALDHVLAEDVISRIDLPPFRQSAMDGYALSNTNSLTYSLIGEIQAGDSVNPNLKIGEAVRIFTGAPVPDTANVVVMQEKVVISGDTILVNGSLVSDMNIRTKGEQIKIGDIALNKGTIVKGVHIGFLASLGVVKVRVYKKPSIAIVVTGNELVRPGSVLSYGEIYESNGAMLTSVLEELGYNRTTVIAIKDDLNKTIKTLKDTINDYDIMIVTGGVSVGDYDFVGKALEVIGVQKIFHGVKQKPGKPLFFGKKERTSIFGLPGNPAAALTCFYIYVYPLLKKYEGAQQVNLTSVTLPLLNDYTVLGSRAQFLKARLQGSGVEVLTGQSSAMVKSIVEANVLVFLPEHSSNKKKGENVKTILLPNK